MARPMNEIQAEYSQVCMKLGDADYRIRLLERQIENTEQEKNKLGNNLDTLNKEAAAAARAEQEKQAEAAPEVAASEPA